MKLRERASIVCLHENRLLCVRLRDPQTKREYLFPPGGKLEPGETRIEAAVRETKEETGYEVTADPKSELSLRYHFVWNGIDYDCLTHFYRGRLGAEVPSEVVDADYLVRVEWVSRDQISTILSFHEGLRQAVLQLCR